MTAPVPPEALDAALTAAVAELNDRYRRIHQLDGFHETAIPDLRAALSAALPAAAPVLRDHWAAHLSPIVVNIEGTLTPEQADQIKADFLAAVAHGGPPTVLPTDNERIRQLEQLATDMLSRYTQTQDGYRARVGQVQVAKWQATLRGDQ